MISWPIWIRRSRKFRLIPYKDKRNTWRRMWNLRAGENSEFGIRENGSLWLVAREIQETKDILIILRK